MDGGIAAGQITHLLTQIRGGNADAQAALIPLVYDELCRRARHYLRSERIDRRKDTRSLVHEAYARLVSSHPMDFENRAHFFAVAAKVMHNVLVDLARKRSAEKHGGKIRQISLDGTFEIGVEGAWDDIILVGQLLERLKEIDERGASVVEMKFFGGLEEREIAEVLGRDVRTVRRDWEFARTWLYKQMLDEMSKETSDANVLSRSANAPR